MIRPRFEVHIYKKDDTDDYSWSNSYTDITDIVEISESNGIEARKDSFSFRVMNKKDSTGSYDSMMGLKENSSNRFSIRDNVKIYMWNGSKPSDFTDALIIDGLINEISQDSDEQKKLVSVKGANRTEVLLNNMVPTVVGSPGETPPTIVKDIINRVNSFDKNKKLVAALDDETMYGEINGKRYILSTAGSIQTKHADGSDFEIIQYSQNWKNAYEQIEELSSVEKIDPTGSFRNEGAYIFDIVNTKFTTPEGDVLTFNTARWRNKSITVVGSIVENSSSGSGFSSSKIQLGTFDVINAAIVAGGDNLMGGGVLRVVYNSSSMGRLGARWKFIPLVKTFDDIYNKESTHITDSDGDRFPDSYDYTFKTVESGSVVSSDKEFNDALVGETSLQIKELGQQIVDMLGDARFKANFELYYGNTSFNNGDLFYLNVPSYGWYGSNANPGKILRLVNQSHLFNKSGWKTTLFLEEDEKVVSDLVNK